MDEKTIQQVIFGILGALALVALAIKSGVLWWAILAGMVVLAATFWFTREWKQAVAGGIIATVGVSAFGIIAMMAPGWYKPFLDTLS